MVEALSVKVTKECYIASKVITQRNNSNEILEVAELSNATRMLSSKEIGEDINA